MHHQRVLVTGGAGFLGSHLCDRLIREGRQVMAVDDYSTGTPDNVAHLRHNRHFSLVEHDVTEPFDLKFDRAYHLASPASPRHYGRDPLKTTLTNVLGTYHVLDAARRCGGRVLLGSTSEVYGDPEQHPQREDYRGSVSPTGVRACYDEGKRCAESIVTDFQRAAGVPVRIARIFNTYGPRMAFDDGRVVSNFIVQALSRVEITLHGSGLQTRSFCYVDDMVDGLVRLMDHPDVDGPVNLGNPAEITVRELAEEVLWLAASDSPIVTVPLPEDDPKRRCPDIGKARRLLGFEPRVGLREGLARTLDDFRQRLLGEEDSGVRSCGKRA